MAEKKLGADEAQTKRAESYTEADVEAIVSFWHEGLTAKDIAIALDRKYVSVRNKIRQLQKKGVIKTRTNSNTLPDGFVEHTAAAFGLPVELVSHFCTLFSGGQDRIIAGVSDCCIAWAEQQGKCYYLGDHVRLTMDDSPSGVVVMYGQNNRPVLVCKAISHTRNTMGHDTFVSMCRVVAERFTSPLP